MPKRLPLPNLTAVLALSALADLVLYRIISAIFLPSQDSVGAARWLAGGALFFSNFSGLLALVLAVVALLQALGSEQVFPRSMRITVSTVGLFFCSLAAIGVLWNLAPQYGVHLRISHGFLAFFLGFGIWRSRRPWRAKLGITLFAIPLVIQALALFLLRMAWTRVDPGELVRAGQAVALLAAIVAPLLVAPWPWPPLRAAVTIATGVTLATLGTLAIALRFDLVQAALFYGLRIDLTGLASTPERVYSGALVTAFACLGAAIASCLFGSGRSRLAGWGLLLVAAAGTEIASPKPALFSLCGLFALALASAPSASGWTEASQAPRTEEGARLDAPGV